MRRLILLGNGFDLAHKLKTDYNSFIKWYLKQCFEAANSNGEYIDNLISIRIRYDTDYYERQFFSNIEFYVDFFYEKGLYSITYPTFQRKGYQNDYENPFTVNVNSTFFELLLKNCSSVRWVDIENYFYECLKGTLAINIHAERAGNIDALNESMKTVIMNLEQYLINLPKAPFNKLYNRIFRELIYKKDIPKWSVDKNNAPESTMVLNFNYTTTAEQYIKLDQNLEPNKRFEMNYIHGKIQDSQNPMIFGFGDELDANYSKIELENENRYFKYIKSFWYFRTSRYHELIRFIDSTKFQVYTLGHSCGLSDRTMLNMIFEHPNCVSIKIFYHSRGELGNNFEKLTQEISRHFTKKSEMRNKIVSFDLSSPMPQSV